MDATGTGATCAAKHHQGTLVWRLLPKVSTRAGCRDNGLKRIRLRQEIRRLNLITAENLIFLEIEELASQQRWRDIWMRHDLSRLAFIPVPREVRASLITAFHQHVLLPEELQGKWVEASGTLSPAEFGPWTAPYCAPGLSRGPVVQVFAYQAAMQQNREELHELITASNNPASLECIKQLLLMLGPERVVIQAPPSQLMPGGRLKKRY